MSHLRVIRVIKESSENHQRVFGVSSSLEKVLRESSESHKKVIRESSKSSESHQTFCFIYNLVTLKAKTLKLKSATVWKFVSHQKENCLYPYFNLPFFSLSLYFLQPVTDFLLKGLQFTHTAAKYMMSGTPVGEAFKWMKEYIRSLSGYLQGISTTILCSALWHFYWYYTYLCM